MAKSLSPPFPNHFLFQIPHSSHPTQLPNLIIINPTKPYPKPPKSTLSSVSSTPISESSTFNGWDYPKLDPVNVGTSNQVQRFLILLGADDIKYLYVYALGFLCALAISRIRVSTVLIFPVSAVVFGIGFTFGYLNVGKGFGLFEGKRKVKEESSRVLGGELKGLVEVFDRLDDRIGELKSDIERATECERIEVGDLEGYVRAVESIRVCCSSARSVVDGSVSSLLAEDQLSQRDLKEKSNRRKKADVQNGFDLFHFVSNFGRKDANGSKSSQKRDSVSSENKDVITSPQERFSGSSVEEGSLDTRTSSYTGKKNVVDPRSSASAGYPFLEWDTRSRSVDRGEEIKRVFDYVKKNSVERSGRTRKLIEDEDYEYQSSSRFRFREKQESTFKTTEYNEMGILDLGISLQRLEREASFTREQIIRNSNGVYKPFQDVERAGSMSNEVSHLEDRMDVENDPLSRNYRHGIGSDASSTFSDDLLFDRYLTEANVLLKGAKECLQAREDEIQAEKMLCDCTELLSKAIVMKPMSLLAMGQLGNTYLLHGELKLRISRKLRNHLMRSKNFSLGREKNELDVPDNQLPSRDRVATLLVDVCQECEDLLVEAGRRYRTALAIDGNDMRALYNWGLALSFRAQLIADIGPEAAHDADKLFLAAIDKFDAMMARSNVYAPDALFRWGMALQQRSRLRPRSSTSKMKLLQQAKRLYEDAIDMGSDNHLVKEALSSCLFELESRRM